VCYILFRGCYLSQKEDSGTFTHLTRSTAFAPLVGAKYMSLTTFRRTGVGVATPVWFAERDGVIYVETMAGAGKIKRLRHTPRVLLAPCTATGKVNGPAIAAQARIITDASEAAIAEAALARKYGFARRAYHGMGHLARVIQHQPPMASVYLAVEPADQNGR